MLVPWYGECTAAHLATLEALLGSYTATADEIAAASGQDTVDDLLASHRLWSTWLRTGRIRKFGIVAEKVAPGQPRVTESETADSSALCRPSRGC